MKTKTRPFRGNPSDQPGRAPKYHPLSVWLRSRNLVSQHRAHMTRGSTGSFTTLNVSNLFVPGWPSTSEIHLVVQRLDDMTPGNHSTQNHSYHFPPRCFINLVVFLVFVKQGFQHLAKTYDIPSHNKCRATYSSSSSTRRCKS